MTVSQPPVSRIIFQLLAGLLTKYIKTPRTQETRVKKQRLFRNLGMGAGAIGIPGVYGSIDCTHILFSGGDFKILMKFTETEKDTFL